MPLDNIPPKWFEHFMSETPQGSSACQQRPTAKSEHASKCACSNCNHLKKKKVNCKLSLQIFTGEQTTCLYALMQTRQKATFTTLLMSFFSVRFCLSLDE